MRYQSLSIRISKNNPRCPHYQQPYPQLTINNQKAIYSIFIETIHKKKRVFVYKYKKTGNNLIFPVNHFYSVFSLFDPMLPNLRLCMNTK